MKKLFLIGLLLPILLTSCSKDRTGNTGCDASIVIKSDIDKTVKEIITRAGEEDGYWLTVTGPDDFTPISQQLGTLRTIEDLEYGEYTVTLTSQQTYTMPAYDLPIYQGSVTKTLFSDTPTPFDIKCTQINVGLQFIFDESVTNFYDAPVATITDRSGQKLSLVPDDYGTKKAYFEPGTLTITLADGDTPIKIGGGLEKDIVTSARELWTITLKTSSKEGGDIELTIEIDKGTIDQTPEFGVGDVTGDGTGERPFSVGAAINAMPKTWVWVQGIITGRTTISMLTRADVQTILIGQTSTSPESECIVVELPAGSEYRTALGLDDPDNNSFVGMRIALRGDVSGKSEAFTTNAFATITNVSELEQNYLPNSEIGKSISYKFKNTVLKTAIPDLPIGTAISHEKFENDPMYAQVLRRDFNSVTSEYTMKMGEIWKNGRDSWNFENADKIVAFAQANGMRVHGHTLIWSQDTEIPQWMDELTWPDGSELWADLMKEYITEVVTHFKGKVASWDVVNEAFNDGDGSYRGSRPGDSSSFWYKKVGDDFIRIAFETAREVLDRNGDTDCKLFYNDYDFVNAEKRRGMIANLRPLVEDGTIEGIGMQMHLKVRALKEVVNPAFADVVAMSSDLLIHASEIDMMINNDEFIYGAQHPDYGDPWITGDYITREELYDVKTNFNLDYAQGKSYNVVVCAYLANVPVNQRYGISTWGFTDKTYTGLNHWLFPDFPMLLGTYYNKKRAYDGFLEGLMGVNWEDMEGQYEWNWRWETPGGYEPNAPWEN